MSDSDPQTFEDALIEEMRANEGRVTTGPLAGHPILVLTSHGAKTDEPRRALLTFTRDNGDYVVAGTAGGSPTTPSWVYNLREHPDVTIEAENRTVPARATIVEGGDERDRLWDQHVERLPWFADYPAQSGRVIPMVRLTPADRN